MTIPIPDTWLVKCPACGAWFPNDQVTVHLNSLPKPTCASQVSLNEVTKAVEESRPEKTWLIKCPIHPESAYWYGEYLDHVRDKHVSYSNTKNGMREKWISAHTISAYYREHPLFPIAECGACRFEFLVTHEMFWRDGFPGNATAAFVLFPCPKCGRQRVGFKIGEYAHRLGYEYPGLKEKSAPYLLEKNEAPKNIGKRQSATKKPPVPFSLDYGDVWTAYPNATVQDDFIYNQRKIQLKKGVWGVWYWMLCDKCGEAFKPPVCDCGSVRVRMLPVDPKSLMELVCSKCDFHFLQRASTEVVVDERWKCPKCGSTKILRVRLAKRRGYEAPSTQRLASEGRPAMGKGVRKNEQVSVVVDVRANQVRAVDSELVKYLGQMVDFRKSMKIPKEFKYCCVEDFVLQNGRSFKPSPLPKGVKRGRMKECFHNSTELMHRGYTYVEGFAFQPRLIPVLHAWCIDKDGNVLDPTWDYDESVMYFGVPMSMDYVLKTIVKNGYYGVLGPDFPEIGLLKGDRTFVANGD